MFWASLRESALIKYNKGLEDENRTLRNENTTLKKELERERAKNAETE